MWTWTLPYPPATPLNGRLGYELEAEEAQIYVCPTGLTMIWGPIKGGLRHLCLYREFTTDGISKLLGKGGLAFWYDYFKEEVIFSWVGLSR